MSHPHNLSHAVNVYETWLKEMEEKPNVESPENAYAALRAVLQTLRDRMTVEEAVHLSAQLPLIARGIFFEGWKPSREPLKLDQKEFYERVRERLNGACGQLGPALITQYAFEIINHHIDPGQIGHVKAILPEDIQSLWPAQKAA